MKIKYSTLPIFLIILSVFVSCKDEISNEISNAEVRNGLRLILTSSAMQGLETPGQTEEDNINPEKLTVMAFDDSGAAVGLYTAEDMVKENETVVVELDEETSGKISMVAVLGNIDNDIFEESQPASIDELRHMAIDFPAAEVIGRNVPLYGEAQYDAEGVEIELTRCLAKIEIRNITGQYSFTGAKLRKYVPCFLPGGDIAEEEGKDNIDFSADEEGDLYIYVAPTDLGEEDDELRHIVLTVKNNSTGEEEECSLWLKDYSGNNAEDWEVLKRNHCYRFDVEKIEDPVPPQVFPTGTIEIRWYPTFYGKFMLYAYPGVNGSCVLLVGDADETNIRSFTPEFYPRKDFTSGYGEFRVRIPLDEYGFKYEKLRYMIIDKATSPGSGFTENKAGEFWLRYDPWNVSEDNLGFGMEVEDDVTVVHLNREPLGFLSHGISHFPLDAPYRIYWRNPEIDKIKKIGISKENTPNVYTEFSDFRYGEINGYRYVEYRLPDGENWVRKEPVFVDSNENVIKVISWYSTSRLERIDYFEQQTEEGKVYAFFLD